MRLLPRRGVKATAPAPAQASVDVSTIATRFNFEWAVDPDNGADQDTYWWWACSIRVDPSEVIAEDGEGGYWSVPFTTDGEDAVTFGAPVQVRETFVPVEATAGVAASELIGRRRQRVLASDLARPEKPARDNPAASRPRQEEAMSPGIDIAALRSRLGLSDAELPDDATEEQINAALTMDAAPEGGLESEGEPGEETAPEGAPDLEAAPAAASARTVIVDREQWEQTQRDASRCAASARATEVTDLDREADDAVEDGRIAPASRASWRDAIDPGENPDAAATARARSERQALASLVKGRVPVRERGAQTTATAGQDDGYARVAASMGLNSTKGA